MSLQLLRPGHLHTADRVISATNEAGITIEPPIASGTPAGTLRLRTSIPWAGALSTSNAILRLLTGGNPTGYATDDAGAGAGAAAIWRNSTDSTSQYRGYIDSMYLVRCEFPVAYSATRGPPSTPRTLPNGSLGFLHGDSATTTMTFTMITTAGVVTTSTFVESNGGNRSDFVVLPSGRLVALVNTGDAYFTIASWYSDDNGATWAALAESRPGATGTAHTQLTAEYVDDAVVVAMDAFTTGGDGRILLSRDGGATFTIVDSLLSIDSPRSCVAPDGTVLIAEATAALVRVHQVAPGGGLGPIISTTTPVRAMGAIVTRDDGTVWTFGSSANNDGQIGIGVSLDNGTTWIDVTGGQYVADPNAVVGTDLYTYISAGSWQGKIIVLGLVNGTTGSDGSIHMLTFGGWESVCDIRYNVASVGQPYEHTYLPWDYPDSVGWTRGNVGAGAVVTNQNALNIASVFPNNTVYTAAAAFWSPAAGATRRVRFRCRVNSGGNAGSSIAMLEMNFTDGANQCQVLLRFATASVQIVDFAGNVLATVVVDQTAWVDWWIALAHEVPNANKLTCSVWHKRDGAALWTNDLTASEQFEAAGGVSNLRFGGTAGDAVNWDIAYLGVADDDNNFAANGITVANGAGLPGRPLSASADYYVTNGMHVGGYNGGGVPGDSYVVATTYQHGKANLWAELRPSRHVRSTADNASWNVVMDAGASDAFKGDLVALFGTNFRTATFQLNATDAWGAPSVVVPMDATAYTGTIGASNRGPGYAGPASSANWRPGQFRSDGDAHRWFVEFHGGDVHEITDNDEDRVYVENVDLSAESGTFYIFGDKMSAGLAFSQYRFARLLVGAQQTADDDYRVGTLVFDKAWTPAQMYDHGYVERINPTTDLLDTDTGYRSSIRLGPRRHTLAIQWPPLNSMGPAGDLERRLRDFYAAIEGSHRPIVVRQTTGSETTLLLCRVVGTYSATNAGGRGDDPVTRIDQLVLEEEW